MASAPTPMPPPCAKADGADTRVVTSTNELASISPLNDRIRSLLGRCGSPATSLEIAHCLPLPLACTSERGNLFHLPSGRDRGIFYALGEILRFSGRPRCVRRLHPHPRCPSGVCWRRASCVER